MHLLKAIDLRDTLLILAVAMVATGVYENWGLGWGFIVLGLLILVPIVVTSWRS